AEARDQRLRLGVVLAENVEALEALEVEHARAAAGEAGVAKLGERGQEPAPDERAVVRLRGGLVAERDAVAGVANQRAGERGARGHVRRLGARGLEQPQHRAPRLPVGHLHVRVLPVGVRVVEVEALVDDRIRQPLRGLEQLRALRRQRHRRRVRLVRKRLAGFLGARLHTQRPPGGPQKERSPYARHHRKRWYYNDLHAGDLPGDRAALNTTGPTYDGARTRVMTKPDPDPALERGAPRAEMLLKITAAIADAVSRDEVYRALVEDVAEAFDASGAAL